MNYKDKFQQILNSENPIELLREFAIDLNSNGMKKQEIYDLFYKYQLDFQENGNDAEADILADVMDMLTGWYLGKNIDLN